MPNIRILPLGGCLLHIPLNEYNKTVRDVRARVTSGGAAPVTYSLGEMIQFVRFLRSEIDIAPEIKELAGMAPLLRPLPEFGDFREVDIVLVEPNTPIEIHFGLHLLNRAAVFTKIVMPLRAAYPGAEVAKMTSVWLTKGVLGGDEATRSHLGGELAGLVSDTMPLADTIRDVLVNARARPRDSAEGLRALRLLLDRPMGVLTFIFQYLPDGRPVSWPAGFRESVAAAAAELNLPIFEPCGLVEKYGVAATLKADLRHYRDEFNPTLARGIVEFAEAAIRQQPVVTAAVT